MYLSDTRDKAAAERFFDSCRNTTGVTPYQITTDKEPAFPSAISNALGHEVTHRDSRYMNNRMEQDHRAIKSRYGPTKGFKNTWCAMIFCHVFEELRQFFRMKGIPLSKRRELVVPRFQECQKITSELKVEVA